MTDSHRSSSFRLWVILSINLGMNAAPHGAITRCSHSVRYRTQRAMLDAFMCPPYYANTRTKAGSQTAD